MSYAKYCLWIALLVFSSFALSQNNKVKGVVLSADSLVICDANIALLSQDSVVAHTVSTEHGFLMDNVPSGTYMLCVSYVGYETRQLPLDVSGDVELGDIILQYGYEIDEIVVKSARNMTSYKDGVMDISVKNTYLAELPDIGSLLKNIPGVSVFNGVFTYFGKGQLLFLINGREVKSAEELNLLQPSQITGISVDNMPGAKYDSRYSAVVDIKTSLEKPALMIYNTDAWARNFSVSGGVTSQIKMHNGSLIDLSYGVRKRKNTMYSEQFEENLRPENIFEHAFSDTLISDRMSHDWSAGVHHEIGKSDFGIEYSGFYSTNSPLYNSLMHSAGKSGNEAWSIFQNGRYRELQNMLSFDYSIDFTSCNVLRVTADYLNRRVGNNSLTSERAAATGEQKHTILDFIGKNNIYSFLTEYGHSFSETVKIIAGFRYSHVHNDDDSEENDIRTLYDLKENRYALYLEGSLKWKNMLLKAGLRSEVFDKYYEYTDHPAMGYKDFFLLPSLSLSYTFSDNIQLSLSANNKVFLPSFNELTPVKTYLNQYSYSIGDPFLKPTVRYDFGVGLSLFSRLYLDVGYSLIKNDRTSFCVPDEDSGQVLKYSYTNIERSGQYSCLLTYSDRLFNRHNISITAGVLVPDVRIPYMDGYLYRDKPSYMCQFYSNWKIGRIVNFSLNYAFQSRSYDKTEVYSPTHNLGCNLSVIPIKDRLTVTLSANDVLRKSYGNWTSNYGYVRTSQLNNADSRNIMISIRYTFNSFKRSERSSSNQEEMERL